MQLSSDTFLSQQKYCLFVRAFSLRAAAIFHKDTRKDLDASVVNSISVKFQFKFKKFFCCLYFAEFYPTLILPSKNFTKYSRDIALPL